MQLDTLTEKSILEQAVFDHLFSIEDAGKHDLLYFDLEDRASALKVKTRFVTRYRSEKKQRERQKAVEKKQQAQSEAQRTTQFNAENYPELLCGVWQCDDDGVRTRDSQGEKIACYNPVMPVKRLSNVETGKEKMVVAFKRDGYWSEQVFDKAVLLSASRIVSVMANFGILVTSESAKHLVRYFCEVEAYNMNSIQKQLSTSKMGWVKGDAFMPYAGDRIVFDSTDRFKGLYESIAHSGSKTAYLTFLKKIRQSPRLEPKMALVASLASVLVNICGALPFIFHIYGEGGKGKTLCLMLAASVWGDPNEGGYIADPKSTPTAFEMRLNMLNHLPFICDDMGSIKKKFSTIKGADFADFIYLVCNGRGNERSNVDLGLNYVPHWKNCSITSSEKPLTSETSQGGEILRTIELESEQGNIFNDGKAVADFMRRNYGFVGRIFIDAVRNIGFDGVRDMQKGFAEQIYAKDTEKEKEGKQVQSMAVMLTADKILTDYVLQDGAYLDFDTMFGIIASNKQMSDNERAYEWVCNEITLNRAKFIKDKYLNEPVQRWGYLEADGWCYVNPNIFADFCSRGNFSRTMFVKWAIKSGLSAADNGRTTKKHRFGDTVGNFICIKTKTEEDFE